MSDIQTAYEATAKVLRVTDSGRYYDHAVKKNISKPRAEEIALSNGIALDDFSVIFRLTKLADKGIQSDQYTVIVALEEIVPAFYIDSEQNGDGKIVAVNSAGDKMIMTDDEFVIFARGMEFVVKLDIAESVYIEALHKATAETFDITGKSGVKYTFYVKNYELAKMVRAEENAESAADGRTALKAYILARRNAVVEV